MELHLQDSALVQAYVRGDEKALELLINRHSQRVYGFIYSKIPDRDLADDVFQDTFIKVIKTLKKGNYSEEGKFLPWVLRISHNLIIDHFRKNARMPRVQAKDDFDIFHILSDGDLNVENRIIRDQVESDLRKMIEALPEDQREVVWMRLYQDLSFKEIAEQTGVSINTALGRMRYAVLNLRKLVEKNNIVLTN